MKKIKKNEVILIEMEKNAPNIDPEKNIVTSPISKKNTTKFSMGNENEFLFNSRPERLRSIKKIHQVQQPKVIRIRKIFECKAKSEEKYTGSPAYQIFMAKNPILQFFHSKLNYLNSPEKRVNKFLTNVLSPESSGLRKSKKDSCDIFEENQNTRSRVSKSPELEIKPTKNEEEAQFMENTSNFLQNVCS